ncbi:isoleucine--tRNA ligase, partial [Mesorhizobium sp. B261B1A]|uniref:isoleucine--tRNA ligase n=1 Tax=Mesorhizobium sp. B261B1A TaxID=2876671 RepID=UPI001CD09906
AAKRVRWRGGAPPARAEAEIEYQDYESDTIWAKFPVASLVRPVADGEAALTEGALDLLQAHVVIWTTTPWTIPGNRAVNYSPRIDYGLYEVTAAENAFGPQPGEKLIFADTLAEEASVKAKVTLNRLRSVSAQELGSLTLSHPFKGLGGGYEFPVPMLAGDHVTDDAGTGFVHTAPGHGREDFDAWMEAAPDLRARGVDTAIPFTVDDAGFFTKDAPGFGPDREGGAARVLDDNGKKGNANQAVIDELIKRNALFARGRLKHSYPHSWRSKKPVIFRNTPQWFVYMDKDLGDGTTLRSRALKAIDDTRFVPGAGQNRIRAMIEERPDWVLSRQRAWGVPIAVFADADGNVLQDEAVNQRIMDAFEKEGADAWFDAGAKERFLGNHDASRWKQVTDILDVWFDSGSTHVFTLEDRPDLKWPADVYLEGSDQHRGWFHSSLLESCGTRGRAPYDTVVTHGFTMDEDGRKMSKSLGNTVVPQDVIKQSGADILRLWVVTTDYWEDQRLGKNVLQTNIDAYRKLRNTIRWMLGTLAHDDGEEVPLEGMPELERLMLHRLAELDEVVRQGYDAFEFKRITRALLDFMVVELSAFYFDIRKDALYCDAPSSAKRKASVQVVRHLFDCLVRWLAPMLPFTMEEAWLDRHPDAVSVHLDQFPAIPENWKNEALAEKWRKVRQVRRVVTGALEIARAQKVIGSSLEAVPVVTIDDAALEAAISDVDMAEMAITSDLVIAHGEAQQGAFTLEDVKGVAVVIEKAEDRGLVKCARSWRYTADVGQDPAFPDVSARDAAVLHELRALGRL